MSKVGFFVVAILAIAVAYFYSNEPHYFDEMPPKMKFVVKLTHLLTPLGILGELTGTFSLVSHLRALRNLQMWGYEDMSDLQVIWTDTRFDGVVVRVYKPQTDAIDLQPAVFYVRGGGFVMNHVAMHHGFCMRLAAGLKAVVVSVQYRLAPEHVFPASLDDCEKALRYLMSHSLEWNVDASRIGVAGDSAGGNLAAALLLRLRDSVAKLEQKIKYQFLINPLLQTHNFTTMSHRLNPHDYTLLRSAYTVLLYITGGRIPESLKNAGYSSLFEINEAVLQNNHSLALPSTLQRVNQILSPALYDNIYTASDFERLAQLTDDDKITMHNRLTAFNNKERALAEYFETYLFNPEFAPLLATSMQDLPSTYLTVCEYDMLRDDGLLFAERLKAAGVAVHVQRYDKYHAYASFEPEEPAEDFIHFVKKNHLL